MRLQVVRWERKCRVEKEGAALDTYITQSINQSNKRSRIIDHPLTPGDIIMYQF